MKVYKVSESVIKKQIKLFKIFAMIIFHAILIASIIITNQESNIGIILFTYVFMLLIFVPIMHFSIKRSQENSSLVELLLYEDFVTLQNINIGAFILKYSEIEQVEMLKNKTIVLKLNNSKIKKYIPRTIENIEDVYSFIQRKVYNS